MDQKNNQDMKHYWMVSATISFVQDGQAMDTNINALMVNDEKFVLKKMLENAQVQAQVQLARSLDNQLPDVKHVYIQSLNYLGHMTEKEFHGEPEKA